MYKIFAPCSDCEEPTKRNASHHAPKPRNCFLCVCLIILIVFDHGCHGSTKQTLMYSNCVRLQFPLSHIRKHGNTTHHIREDIPRALVFNFDEPKRILQTTTSKIKIENQLHQSYGTMSRFPFWWRMLRGISQWRVYRVWIVMFVLLHDVWWAFAYIEFGFECIVYWKYGTLFWWCTLYLCEINH